MEKLQYPRTLYLGLKSFCEKSEFATYTLNFDYLDFHNHMCPRCQKELKVSKQREVKQVGGYGLSAFKHTQVAIPYMICKPCSKNIQKEPAFQRSKKSEALDQYLLSTLGLS